MANVTLIGIKGLEKWTPADRKALVQLAGRLKVNPDWLVTAMKFESGLNPKAVNATSGASGLIQFMPDTAMRLGAGKTKEEAIANIRKMNVQQQLIYVEKYFHDKVGKMHSLADVYAAIFYPVAMGKPSDFVIAQQGTKVYEQNSVFDNPFKGYITASDIAKPVTSIYNAAVNNPRIAVPLIALGGLIAYSALGTAAYLILRARS